MSSVLDCAERLFGGFEETVGITIVEKLEVRYSIYENIYQLVSHSNNLTANLIASTHSGSGKHLGIFAKGNKRRAIINPDQIHSVNC